MNTKQNIFTNHACPGSKKLQDYLNNNLDKKEAHLIEEHLADCEMCSDELEGLLMMKDPQKLDSTISEIRKRLNISETKRIRIKPAYQLAAAIAVILIVSGSIFLADYYLHNKKDNLIGQVTKNNKEKDAIKTEKKKKEAHKTSVSTESRLSGKKAITSSKKISNNEIILTSGSPVDSSIIYYESEEYEKAISYLEKDAKNDDDNPETYYKLARSYYKLKSYEESIKNISKAIEFNDSIINKKSKVLLESIISEGNISCDNAKELLNKLD